MEPVEYLKAGRERLVTKGWTQRMMARDCAGMMVLCRDDRAACYCALGALFAGFPPDTVEALEEKPKKALSTLFSALPGHKDGCVETVASYNDAEGRTLEDILALYDRAIASVQ